jgi:hypothetical protein
MCKLFSTILLAVVCGISYSQPKKLTLSILPNSLAVCQFAKNASIPSYVFKSTFFSITQTDEELSVVCEQSLVPTDVKKADDWRAFKVEGPLDFSQVGILSSLAKPLAENKIPIFVISTYDTDYLLVQSKYFIDAKKVLGKFCTLKEESTPKSRSDSIF